MRARFPSGVSQRLTKIGPLTTTFVGSIALSAMALRGTTLNRDGMLYVETARKFIDGGLDQAMATFSWPFLSILMAWVSLVSGLSLESSGHLINMLFMAGACALCVACADRLFPQTAWYACLVVLALPGFNDYRDELLREYGAWFFVMLALWLSLRWSENPRWPEALAIQAAVLIASLFRPEALVFFLALIFWQMSCASGGERWRRVFQIGGLPALGLAVLGLSHLTGNLESGRLAYDFGRLNWSRFNAKADAMAPAFIEYARSQTRFVLFYGSLAIVPVKFLVKMGVFVIPLAYALFDRGIKKIAKHSQIFFWTFLLHTLVLCIFALDMQFLAGRYVALLLVFSVPATGYGLWLLSRRFPVWKLPVVLMALILMLGNVWSSSGSKHHFVEAGAWLAKHAVNSPRVYIESPRAAYYAGWGFATRFKLKQRQGIATALAQRRYDLLVFEVSHQEADIRPWLREMQLETVEEFSDAQGDRIIIAKPKHQ